MKRTKKTPQDDVFFVNGSFLPKFRSILFAWLGKMRCMEISIVCWVLFNEEEGKNTFAIAVCIWWAMSMHETARGAQGNHPVFVVVSGLVSIEMFWCVRKMAIYSLSPWLVPVHNVIIVGIGRHCRCGKYAVTKWYTEYAMLYIDYTQTTFNHQNTHVYRLLEYILLCHRLFKRGSERERIPLSLSLSLTFSFILHILLARSFAMLPLFYSLPSSS